MPEGPTGSISEQLNTLYHVNKDDALNQSRAVAESSATAIMGRISAYTGQQVTWKEMMVDADINPEVYNLKVKPSAEDFEKGTVEIPRENVIPRAGKR